MLLFGMNGGGRSGGCSAMRDAERRREKEEERRLMGKEGSSLSKAISRLRRPYFKLKSLPEHTVD